MSSPRVPRNTTGRERAARPTVIDLDMALDRVTALSEKFSDLDTRLSVASKLLDAADHLIHA